MPHRGRSGSAHLSGRGVDGDLREVYIGVPSGGETVNLEKALRLQDFLGGHLVLGHVDGVGVIGERVERPGSLILGIEVPRTLRRYLVEKGSVAVDGISLTVNRCTGAVFQVHVIPHTVMKTTLGQKKRGRG